MEGQGLCRGIELDYFFFLSCCMCYTESMKKIGLDFSTSLVLHICNKPPSKVAGSVLGGWLSTQTCSCLGPPYLMK